MSLTASCGARVLGWAEEREVTGLGQQAADAQRPVGVARAARGGVAERGAARRRPPRRWFRRLSSSPPRCRRRRRRRRRAARDRGRRRVAVTNGCAVAFASPLSGSMERAERVAPRADRSTTAGSAGVAIWRPVRLRNGHDVHRPRSTSRDAYLRRSVARRRSTQVDDVTGRPRPHRLLPDRRRPAPRHRRACAWAGGEAPGDRGRASRATTCGTPSTATGARAAAATEVAGDDRLGPPPPADAHPHRPARAVRGDLERVGRAGHRRQHGAAGGPHGLRVRPDARGLRRPGRGAGQRPRSPPTGPSRCRSCPGRGRAGRGASSAPRSTWCPSRWPRSGSSTSSASTSRPTAAPTCAPPAEVGGVRVVKTESKGKGNKRVRIEVVD